MAIVKCPQCGKIISDATGKCPYCGAELTRPKASEASPNENAKSTSSEEEKPQTQKPKAKETEQQEQQASKSGKSNLVPIILCIVLAILILSVGGFFLYNNVIKPKQIDKAAPRYYTFAPSVVLRSSQSSGADFNKVASLPYGTELITYSYDNEWSSVKVNSVNADGKKLTGYIASRFILDKNDFFLLNSIFGDEESKAAIPTSKCRRALLNYYKENGYVGNISPEMAMELGIPTPSPENQWLIFCYPKDMKTNNVYYKRILNKDSKFTDFAVIIKNVSSGERRLLLFYFDEDETPHLAAEQEAPADGTIKKISPLLIDDALVLQAEYTD